MKNAIILAGGIGKRMGQIKIPKQFLEINNTPIIILTLKNILASNIFDRIFIIIHSEWREYLYDLLQAYEIQIPRENIIDGGEERLDSIQNALDFLKRDSKEDDIVLFHDAVRPFADAELFKRAVQSTQQFGACVAVIPAKDTMIIAKDEVAISMPDRNTLFHGQSPDSFKFGIIYKCFQELSDEERVVITGTAQICQIKGVKVHTFIGDEKNIKITSVADLFLAKAIHKELCR